MLDDKTRKEIAEELAWLEKRRKAGRFSRQREAQRDWLIARQELDSLERDSARVAQRLAEVRRAHAQAKQRIAEQQARLSARLEGDPGELLARTGEVAAAAGELAGLQLIERELRKRSREEEATGREISTAIKRQIAQVQRIRDHTGLPVGATIRPSQWADRAAD